MKDYNSFMNIDINMDDFEKVYNSMAKNQMKFGGGNMKVNQLLNKFLSKKMKGGENTNADNFFHTFAPNMSPTNINSMSDYTYKDYSLPSIVANNRS